jgi:hypothetical protein
MLSRKENIGQFLQIGGIGIQLDRNAHGFAESSVRGASKDYCWSSIISGIVASAP